MRIAALFVLICACLSAQVAGIQGTVVDAVTRQPMAGVHITMFDLAGGGGAPDQAYGAMSGRDGHFSIANMKPATYLLAPQRNGFVHVPNTAGAGWASVSVTLKPGEQLTGFTLELTPRAVIAGRVTDESGDPVRSVQVDATPASPDTPQGILSRGMNGRTDERGQFRIVGAPGKYYVKATLNRPQNMSGLEIRTDGTQAAVYGPTWFPGSESRDRASVVEVAAGRDVTGIDIRLARQRSLSVGGVVTGIPRGSRAFIYIAPGGETQQQFAGLRTTYAEADGKFTFAAMAPGAYRLWAQVFPSPGSALVRSQFADVRIDSADESGVSLRLAPGDELSGTVEVQGDPPNGAPAEKRTVLLEPLTQLEKSFSGQTGTGEVDKDGAFRISSVFPGKLRVRIDPLPENAYVKSVKVDSAEAPDGVLDLSRGVRGSRIKVTISRNGGQLEGAVLGDDGQPHHAAILFVALAATVEDISFENIKRIVPGAKFSFKGIRPGKYRLLAVDPLGAPDVLTYMKEAFPRAPEIEIREGDRVAKDINVMAKEKPDAK